MTYLIRHSRSDTPVYIFWVHEKPRTRNKERYKDAVAQAAKTHIPSPITAKDIEVEIVYSALVPRPLRADIDNIIKPTLDALNGVAYLDDSQVRSVTATLLDRTERSTVYGRVEHLWGLLDSRHQDVLLISVYSDSRLDELGGKEAVERIRYEEWSRQFPVPPTRPEWVGREDSHD